MDWQKIWLVLDVIHKAQNVPNTELIRRRAMEELVAWNRDDFVETPSTEEPEFAEFGARRL
jgi:hypothetical protein